MLITSFSHTPDPGINDYRILFVLGLNLPFLLSSPASSLNRYYRLLLLELLVYVPLTHIFCGHLFRSFGVLWIGEDNRRTCSNSVGSLYMRYSGFTTSETILHRLIRGCDQGSSRQCSCIFPLVSMTPECLVLNYIFSSSSSSSSSPVSDAKLGASASASALSLTALPIICLPAVCLPLVLRGATGSRCL